MSHRMGLPHSREDKTSSVDSAAEHSPAEAVSTDLSVRRNMAQSMASPSACEKLEAKAGWSEMQVDNGSNVPVTERGSKQARSPGLEECLVNSSKVKRLPHFPCI